MQMGCPKKGSPEGEFEYRPEGRERASKKKPVKMHQGKRASEKVLGYKFA